VSHHRSSGWKARYVDDAIDDLPSDILVVEDANQGSTGPFALPSETDDRRPILLVE
jgi:hypothetical protein